MTTAGVDTIVRGGRIVTASDTFEGSVAIAGEKIVLVGPDEQEPGYGQYLHRGGPAPPIGGPVR